MTSLIGLVERLAQVSPDLQRLLSDHRREYGAVLGTIFLGDLANWCVQQYTAGDIGVVSRALSVLEGSFASGDHDMQNLIAVGFVEDMPHTGQQGAEMRNLLGPQLSAEYERVNW